MQLSFVLSAVLVALCCISTVYSSAINYGIDCKCSCFIPSKRSEGSLFELEVIHLNKPTCDSNPCDSACKLTYTLCEESNGQLRVLCAEVKEPEPNTTMTTTVPTTTVPTTTTSTTTDTPSTSTTSTSTTTGTTSTSTQVPTSTSTVSTSTTTATTTAAASTTTTVPSSTTTSTLSSSVVPTNTTSGDSTSVPTSKTTDTPWPTTRGSTTPKSSGNVLQSVFQISHILLLTFAVLFMFS